MSYIDMADTGQIIDLQPEPSDIGGATGVIPLDDLPSLPRRPRVDPRIEPSDRVRIRSIGVVDKPADTGQLPAYAQAALYVTRPTPTQLPVADEDVARQPNEYRAKHRWTWRVRLRRAWLAATRRQGVSR